MRGGGEPDPSFFEVPLSGFEPEIDPVRTMPFFEYFKTSGQTVRWCRIGLAAVGCGWMNNRLDGWTDWMDVLIGWTDFALSGETFVQHH